MLRISDLDICWLYGRRPGHSLTRGWGGGHQAETQSHVAHKIPLEVLESPWIATTSNVNT